MPADVTGLTNAIKAVFDNAMEASKVEDADADAIRQSYAEGMAVAIATFVSSYEITLPPGSIQVQGSATAQANTIPLVITGALS